MASIVFVNRAGRVSGAEVVLLRLIEAARERGDQVRVVSPVGVLADRLPEDVAHVEIDELDLGGASGVARVLALGTLARRWIRAAAVIRRNVDAHDVVIVNSLLALPAARFARLRQGVSWLVHDTIDEAKQRAMVKIGRPAIRRAVAVSPPTAAPVQQLGLDVSVSPLGVDIPGVRAQRGTRSQPVIGIMGVITPWKGHQVLLQALTQVPEVRCEVAGSAFHADADYLAELQRFSDAELDGRVRFLGHVDPVATVLNWDILVNASTSPEAGPIVALEAMSVGVPVIATDHGGSSWLLRDGAGVLVPVGDAEALGAAITRVLENPSGVAEMVERAYERVWAVHDAQRAFPAMLDALLPDSRRELTR
ncbi:glycosyltransferase family 4 protein [Mycobacterium sp. 360MFTsu5.1]|uniref:glycosyltransferase family 4 protein n=1 Tax=Mycobacterium sp. 360MFTsu5.1 TaxID=1172186 RepID=UPI0003746680|nr:glycosyltransferase family 4 protein [Mycobacterium sp. 360MFTsu5.1]